MTMAWMVKLNSLVKRQWEIPKSQAKIVKKMFQLRSNSIKGKILDLLDEW